MSPATSPFHGLLRAPAILRSPYSEPFVFVSQVFSKSSGFLKKSVAAVVLSGDISSNK